MAASTQNKPEDSKSKLVSTLIKIEGEVLDTNYSIFKIVTFKEVNKISRAQIHIYGGDSSLNKFEESDDGNFDIGSNIEIFLGYDQKNTVVFKGIIEKHGISIKSGFQKDSSKSLLVIDCVDKAVMLTNSYTTEIFQNKTDSQILRQILQKIPSLSCNVADSQFEHSVFPKYNSDDWSFILKRAKQNGFVVINSNNSISINSPNVDSKGSELVVSNGGATVSFDAKIDTSTQLNSLKINSSDSFKGDTFSKISVEPSEFITKSTNKSNTKNLLTSPQELEINLAQDIDASELKVLADSYLKILRLQKIIGEVTFKGVTTININTIVTLSGFGKKFDGEVYVTAVNHEASEGTILTNISFGIKKSVFSKEQFINKNVITEKIEGLHIGTITQIDEDPKNENRLKVTIPALQEGGEGIWAKLTHFYTTTEGGSFFIPDVGAQVVISFISNDTRFPIILGCIYTSSQEPYTNIENENSLKSIVTKNKSMLEFDDSENKITLTTAEGNSIIINEKNKEIIISDENSNIIKTSSAGIDISSNGNIKISAKGNIEMSASKKMSIKAISDLNAEALNITQSADSAFTAKGNATAEISASGQTTVKGAIVMIN